MLITFSCSAYADITMFGDIAVRLLKLMGHSGKVPGAILADNVPAALQRLSTAIEEQQRLSQPNQDDEDQEDDPKVSLAHRALPLLELLRAAVHSKCNVMWDKYG